MSVKSYNEYGRFIRIYHPREHRSITIVREISQNSGGQEIANKILELRQKGTISPHGSRINYEVENFAEVIATERGKKLN